MKKNVTGHFHDLWKKKRLLLKMKLTFIIIISCLLQVSASVYSQSTKFSFNVNEKKVIDLLMEIEEKSDFRFFFQREQIDTERKVNLNVQGHTVEQILSKIFDGHDVTFQVMDNNLISISPTGGKKSLSRTTNQKIAISGKVVDANDQPLPGVSIVVKGTTTGTTTGTITDFDGNFSMGEVESDAILVFSFVGMKTQEIVVSGQRVFAIVLEEDAIGIDEVVAIGYGTQSVAKITTSISRVNAGKMKNTSYSNMGAALSGLTHGIILKQSGSGPGNDIPAISIRGGGEPLYVIDGIISLKTDFVRLNAADIEDISILKDAGATAVYGSRAANGVVLVTTKEARENKISYSNNFSWGALANQPEYLNAYEYVQFYNMAASLWGLTPPYPSEELEKWKSGKESGYKSTMFWDESYKKYSLNQRHNVTIQGKENNSDYLFSMSYQDQGSRYLYDDTHYQRVYNVLAKIGKNFDNLGLSFDANLRAMFRDYKSTIWDYYYMMTRTNEALPIWQPFNSEGNYMMINGIYNPFYMQDPANGYNMVRDKRYVGTGTLKWKVPKVEGLDVTFIANYETNLNHNKRFSKLQPFYTSDNVPIYQQLPSLSESKNNSQNYTIQSFINYKNSFGKHNVEGSIIYEEYEYGIWNMAASRKDYMGEVLDNLSFGSQSGLTNSGTMDESARRGLIGRFVYDYDAKYLISSNFRYDASERFQKGNRWGFFPSVSLGWRISEEKFMKSILSKAAINNMKFRFSYGEVGNDEIYEVGNDEIARFAYLSTYNVADKRYYQNGQWKTGLYDNGLPAEDISWYTQTNYNAGMDIDFFNNRLKTTFDGFYYRTYGFLSSPAAPYTVPLGTGLPQINKGSQRRGGYEVGVRWKDNVNEFNYSIEANLTHYESFWEENPEEDETTLKDPNIRTTYQSDDYYTLGYINQGYYKDMEDVINSPRLHGMVDILPGDLKYLDANGDGKIDADDRRRIGVGNFPKYYFSLNFFANWKGFNIGAVIQGATKFNIEMTQVFKFERGAEYTSRKELTDIWTPDNPNARFPRINMSGTRSQNYQTTDFWLLDGSYGRLKNLELGYDLKYALLKDMKIFKRFYIYLNGTNLFTVAPGLDNLYDPEDGSGNVSSYPLEKTFSFGVNIDF